MATKPMKTLKLPGLDDTYTFLQNDTTLAVSGKAADAKATGDALAAVQTQVDSVQEGQYPDMGAGQLLSKTGTVNPTPYTYRANTSGSDRVTISQITGGTVAFNQLVDTATTSVTVASGHKYVALVGGTWSVGTSDGTALTVTGGTDMVFDLTQMFGSAVADYLYSLETATAGAGVALFRTMFPESYYPYNTGELVSVQTSGRKTVGFNQWDEVWELGTINASGANQNSTSAIRTKNYIRVIPGQQYYVTCGITMNFLTRWYDGDKNFISTSPQASANNTVTAPAGACYLRFGFQAAYGTTYKYDVCVNISDPSRNGTYEPYSSHTYPLDSTLTLRGVPVMTDDGVPAYDGDQYTPDGTVTRRYGIVDLGTLSWTLSGTANVYYANLTGINQGTAGATPKLICPRYQTGSTAANTQTDRGDGFIWNEANFPRIRIHDSTIDTSNPPSGKTAGDVFAEAMSGVYLVYELATPTTETAAPYQEIQIAGSTEAFLPPATDTRAAAVPVGSQSLYQTNLRAGLEALLDTDLAHAESIALVQGGTASANIASGELLMQGGKLYKATQAIVAGAEIGSTNTTETTLAAQLAALEARIAALEN